MKKASFSIALIMFFLTCTGIETTRAGPIMAPVHAGLQTCAQALGGIFRAATRPEAVSPCCGAGNNCGHSLAIVEPRRLPRHRRT